MGGEQNLDSEASADHSKCEFWGLRFGLGFVFRVWVFSCLLSMVELGLGVEGG